jgi:hypothetical protein
LSSFHAPYVKVNGIALHQVLLVPSRADRILAFTRCDLTVMLVKVGDQIEDLVMVREGASAVAPGCSHRIQSRRSGSRSANQERASMEAVI